MMKGIFRAFGLGLLLCASAQAVVVVDYDLSGATTAAPTDWTATTVDPGVTAGQLVRGSGLVPAGLTNGFSSDHWGIGESTPTPGNYLPNVTQAEAATNNDYYEWSFTVAPGSGVSLDTLDLAMRRSATNAPESYAVYASLDNFATAGTEVANWHYYGRSSGTAPVTVTPLQWMTTDTPGQNAGNPIATQTLSDDPLLQSIAENTTVTFRLYGWFEGASGSASSNTVALGRVAGPKLSGTVIPEPGSLSLLAIGAIAALRRRRH